MLDLYQRLPFHNNRLEMLFLAGPDNKSVLIITAVYLRSSGSNLL